MRSYVIGDIHGCVDELRCLIDGLPLEVGDRRRRPAGSRPPAPTPIELVVMAGCGPHAVARVVSRAAPVGVHSSMAGAVSGPAYDGAPLGVRMSQYIRAVPGGLVRAAKGGYSFEPYWSNSAKTCVTG